MRKLLHAGVLALGVFAAGCGAAGDGSATEPMVANQVNASPTSPGTPTSSSPSTSPATRAEVRLGDTKIGKVLVGERDRTLYLFEKDKGGKSSCSGPCAQAWPPFLTDGKPRAGKGVKEKLLGTTKRDDGTTQVTYNHHPLYYFIKDTTAGETNGQDLNSFGADWYAVGADGKKVPG
ncbi:COG4315 family predicted lipoprotein [Streptosporangium sp. CA-115845]|uniref:COG4315 family predicted lipoprotein n=1 Tax=Streptosporangium sp. CA-115845 TaxID=3240071 RepID=UPI003D94AE27